MGNKTFTQVPKWQQDRAAELHVQFNKAVVRIRVLKISKRKAVNEICARLSTKVLRTQSGDVKPMKAGFTTLLDAFNRWLKGGRKADVLLHDYRPGRSPVPRKLCAHIYNRATQTGIANFSVVINALRDAWKNGEEIPGLGTWREWWANKHPELPEPTAVPDFPFSERTLYRAAPAKADRALGNKGVAAFREKMPFVRLDYSQLRKCELYTLDDVRLDILCIDEATGKPTVVVCYILMEVASRMIVAYILKPDEPVKQEDVDELLAYGLQRFGIGDGYVTHIKFERGATACSEAAEKVLFTATDDGIQVHRTSMNGGIRWIGAPQDKAKGHAAGKAVIESFNRKLHLALMTLPGQRGNKYENQPANLGYEGANKITPGSMADECQKLAQFQIVANKTGNAPRLRLKLSLLYLKQLDLAVREAIKKHNTDPGHDYQGHGKFEQAEVAPGVWEEPDREIDLTPAPADRQDAARPCDASPDQNPALAPVVSGAGAVSNTPKKTYVLKDYSAKATAGQYWGLWKQVEALYPQKKNLRHSLTHRVLGSHPRVEQMTAEQLAKMISVFEAIIRDAK